MTFSITYRSSPQPPVFGGRTARASFCEEDFIITGWVGEFINTVSNLAYFFYAYQGLRRRRTASASWASDSLYYSLALVGLCSAVFHGLVKYYAQLSDDTSMQIATACCLHRAVTFGKGQKYSRNFAILLITSISIETFYHSIMDEHVVHELTFLLLILLVARQTRALINQRISKAEDKRMLKWLSMFGTASFLFGYLLWNLDFIYCPQLTAWKRAIGMPWSFVLEFHGWWHIFTAIGAYVFMVMVDSLTNENIDLSGGPYAWLSTQYNSRGKRN